MKPLSSSTLDFEVSVSYETSEGKDGITFNSGLEPMPKVDDGFL